MEALFGVRSHAGCGLGNPMNYSLPSFSVRGILQARMLEWVAIFFSGRSS